MFLWLSNINSRNRTIKRNKFQIYMLFDFCTVSCCRKPDCSAHINFCFLNVRLAFLILFCMLTCFTCMFLQTTTKAVNCCCFYKYDDTLLITYGADHLFFWRLFWDPVGVQDGKLYRDKLSGVFEVRISSQLILHTFIDCILTIMPSFEVFKFYFKTNVTNTSLHL